MCQDPLCRSIHCKFRLFTGDLEDAEAKARHFDAIVQGERRVHASTISTKRGSANSLWDDLPVDCARPRRLGRLPTPQELTRYIGGAAARM